MNKIVAKQRDFFKTGQTLNIKFRIEKLKALKNALKKYDSKLIEALYTDLNKSSFESILTETGFVYEEINLFLKNIKKWSKPERISVPITLFPGSSRLYKEPYGVSLIISPWNYPVQLTLSPLIASIAAGNCSVLKLSEYSENTSNVLYEMIKETFEEEYITAVTGDALTGAALLLEKFDYIFFTGNSNIGRIVMKSAASNLTPVTLELGGKSPCFVDKSADIKKAAKSIIWGKSLNAGQTCVAPDYILAHKDIKKDLISELINYSTSLYGEHSALHEDFPKIISKRHYDRIISLIDSSKIIYGGKTDTSKLKIDLTIMDNVLFTDKIMSEEIFAPILPIIKYDNIDDIINTLKEKEKPLALYIFANDKNIEEKLINSLSFGGGAVNDVITHITNSNAPFGGVGNSGLGMYHGKYSFDTFSHKKHIYKKYTFFDNGLRYFPKNSKEKILKFWFYR